MAKTLEVLTIADAEVHLRNLASQGYDVFRGQHNNWPVRPSLFRKSISARKSSVDRLTNFISWCEGQPRLSVYLSDPKQFIAIAQHYGIATSLVDATYSWKVALFFALHDSPRNEKNKPVVFAWKKRQLEKLFRIQVVEVQVDNLWRLEAQQGLFLDFLEDVELGDRVDCQCLSFASPIEFTDITIDEIYPARKSLLETVLDIYFYSEETESALEELTKGVPFVIRKKWRSYRAAFQGKRIVLSSEKFNDIDRLWFEHKRTTYVSVGSAHREVFHLKLSSLSSTLRTVEKALSRWDSGACYPEFKVGLFGEAIKDHEVSRAFNHVFDGLVAFPYSNPDRLACLATCIRLLVLLPESEVHGEERAERVLGETVVVEFAPMAGRHLGCAISREALENTIDDEAYGQLRPFFRRYLRDRKLDILCFSLDHLFDFKFPDFITLFATQVIPSQLASYLNEHLLLLADGGGALWDVAFDPIALGYFSISKYQFEYPFALEDNIDKVLILFKEMTELDIVNEIICAAPDVLRSDEPVSLRLHGFSQDSREIWQIPEAVEVLRLFANHGGMSIISAGVKIDRITPRERRDAAE